METELNCGKRRRRIESPRRTSSLTFLRIRVSDEDVVTISVISRHADGCYRIRQQLCTTTSETTIVLRATSDARAGRSGWQPSLCHDDLSLGAIKHHSPPWKNLGWIAADHGLHIPEFYKLPVATGRSLIERTRMLEAIGLSGCSVGSSWKSRRPQKMK
jgi:hypothetical protein